MVNVAACLRELRDGLAAFKRRMREVQSRKISGRQLSDLAVLKIEPETNRARRGHRTAHQHGCHSRQWRDLRTLQPAERAG